MLNIIYGEMFVLIARRNRILKTMKYLGHILFCLSLFTSCAIQYDSDWLNLPAGYQIDLNSDSINDFSVEYDMLQTLDHPSSGGAIIGSIRPNSENQLLYRKNIGYLFLNKNDTIKKNDFIDSWFGYNADLITLQFTDNQCDSNWRILSQKTEDYYVACKLNFNSTVYIGWMLLDFDAETGKIIVINHALDTSEILVIRK